MSRGLAVVVVALFALGCGSEVTSDETALASGELQQGLEGRAERGLVNCESPPSTRIVAGSAPVHVVAGLVPTERTPAGRLLPPRLEEVEHVATVKPDGQGEFRVPLPEGTYTLFTEYEHELFIPCFKKGSEGVQVVCFFDVPRGRFVEVTTSEPSEVVCD